METNKQMPHKLLTTLEWIGQNSDFVLKAVFTGLVGWILMALKWLCFNFFSVSLALSKPEFLLNLQIATYIFILLSTICSIIGFIIKMKRDKKKFDYWKRTKEEDESEDNN